MTPNFITDVIDADLSSGRHTRIVTRFPPEPIRFLGGLVVREAVRRKEGREDRGLSCDPVTGAVAGLAPQGFFRVNR